MGIGRDIVVQAANDQNIETDSFNGDFYIYLSMLVK